MRKVKLYIAISMNGKIAKADGSVKWLEEIPNPDQSDYGYREFYEGIDITIQGNNTYRQLLSWDIDFPYKDKINYVFTRQSDLINNDDVQFISENHISKVEALKKEAGKDIWLVGGGQLVSTFFNANLIDEIDLFIMPIVISDGIDLFVSAPVEKMLVLKESKSFASGVVHLRYIIDNSSKKKS